MLLETHLHTYLGSPCGKLSPTIIANLYDNKNYNGIVITEHYIDSVFSGYYPKGSFDFKMDTFLTSYEQLTRESKKFNIKIFLGMEIAINQGTSDYLIYGITKEFLKSNTYLYKLNQQQLFELCQKNNLFMVQAHPFRKNITVGDPLYMNGVEVYNGNKRHNSHNRKALSFAKKNNLKQFSGSDFHEKEDLGLGGIIVPNEIETNNDLVNYFFNNQPKLIKNGRIK